MKKIISVFLLIMPVLLWAIPPGMAIPYTKLEDGILLKIKKPEANGPTQIRLKVYSDRIIRVSASPEDSIASSPSLMILKTNFPTVEWEIIEAGDKLLLKTKFLQAEITPENGRIIFSDHKGNILLKEKEKGSKSFHSVTYDGEKSFSIQQVFEVLPGEAFYGFGQHQQGIMNYRGHQVDLTQHNTQIAVPFYYSSANYGILWDNYSITKAGNTNKYQPLSSMRLFNEDHIEGWLTAKYVNKHDTSEIYISRPESVIAYDYLSDQHKFPGSLKLGNSKVIWEGFIQPAEQGKYQFFLRYGGYCKIWIDGLLQTDRWRQSWNPGMVTIPVHLSEIKKHHLKIEWIPDGDLSYISLNFLKDNIDADNTWSLLSESGKSLDYYFVYGENADEVIGGYRLLTGKAPIVPKWALGFWQSRERYKTQQELLDVVKTFRDKKIPIDNIVLDWSYWEEDQWGSQAFDKSRFPDADRMIRDLHEKYNTRIMISVWPKFYEGIPAYENFNKNGWLLTRNIANQTRDWIAKGYTSTFYDPFNPDARKGLWALMDSMLYKKGIDAWWMDATEPDIHSNTSPEGRKELMAGFHIGSGSGFFNAYPLENARAVYEGQMKSNPDKRVFILTRSAYAGMQRYGAAAWSGDISSRWHDFRDQIPAGINFSLSGLPYWTMDIGGFAVEKRFENAKGKDLEEWQELNTRWFQYGAFCPIFRSHGQFPFREIFNIAPDDHPAYKSMLHYNKLRYRLMPYIYSLAGHAYFSNSTIMRGLIMDFREDSLVYNITDQYMFGPAFLVSPVTEYKSRSRNVYLPDSSGWYDFNSGKFYNGGQTIDARAVYERMPLFVRAGSIIPMGPQIQHTSEKPTDPLKIFVFTGEDGKFSLYEDQGTNNSYLQDQYSVIELTYLEQSQSLHIDERKGKFPGMLQKRKIEIVWIDKNQSNGIDPDQKSSQKITYSGKPVTINKK